MPKASSRLAAIALAIALPSAPPFIAAAQSADGAAPAASAAASAAKYNAVAKACNGAADTVVWLIPGSKLFYRKGAAKFGKGVGSYVCRHVALSKHARDATSPRPTATPAAEPSAPPAETTAAPTTMSSPVPEISLTPAASAAPTMAP